MNWKPIVTAPKNTRRKIEYILIREGNCLPDLVVWKGKTRERTINGTKYLSRPAGWFTRNGGRSPIIRPTEWHELPD